MQREADGFSAVIMIIHAAIVLRFLPVWPFDVSLDPLKGFFGQIGATGLKFRRS